MARVKDGAGEPASDDTAEGQKVRENYGHRGLFSATDLQFDCIVVYLCNKKQRKQIS